MRALLRFRCAVLLWVLVTLELLPPATAAQAPYHRFRPRVTHRRSSAMLPGHTTRVRRLRH